MKASFLVIVVVMSTAATVYIYQASQDDLPEQGLEPPVNIQHTSSKCDFDRLVNNTEWRLEAKHEKKYFLSLGNVDPL